MERILSIDTVRVIAILAIIAIHTYPFGSGVASEQNTSMYLAILINQLSRFAVPFFFIISGYFWGIKIRKTTNVWSISLPMIQRLLLIFMCWSIIYLIPYNTSGKVFDNLLDKLNLFLQTPIKLLFEGTKDHLWFLTALACAVIICSLFVQFKKTKALFVFALLLYVFGVLALAYANTSAGIKINFNTRNGPFFSTLLFFTGYHLSGLIAQKKWFFYGLIIFSIGTALHFSEVFILWKKHETTVIQDYVFSTCFMGLGISLVALSNYHLLQSKKLSEVGKLTLGIYASHYLFVDLFSAKVKTFHSGVIDLVFLATVFLLSLLVTLLFSKNRYLKKIVM